MKRTLIAGLAAIALAAGIGCAKDNSNRSQEYEPECAYLGQEVHDGKTLEMYKCEVRYGGSYYWLSGYTKKIGTGLYSYPGQLLSERWLIRKDKEGHCESTEYHSQPGPFSAYTDEESISLELYDNDCNGTVDMSFEHVWKKAFTAK